MKRIETSKWKFSIVDYKEFDWKVLDDYYKLVPPRKEFKSVPSEETKQKLRKKRKN